ncbi:hypothetical protein, partial [Blautia wexlerae]|uniref:hypothetical protein n=1 Tax=Blautia wexlerae TaxID=418240 RepID=UPI0034A1CE16
EKNKLLSTKEEKGHGIGLANVRKMVISGIYGCFEYKSDFYCKGNAVLINYVESMKDSVVVGLRCLLFCRKLVKRENIVKENLIKNHNMF